MTVKNESRKQIPAIKRSFADEIDMLKSLRVSYYSTANQDESTLALPYKTAVLSPERSNAFN